MLIDKPAGVTSHDVVRTVRRALGTRAVGHTGTLDPFATGLLVVLVGSATRLARFVEGRRKRYLAVARLGLATTTDDLDGEPLPGGALRDVAESELRDAFAALAGDQLQRPPAYSAKHVDGQRSYRLARRGTLVELPAVPVSIGPLELVARRGDQVTFRVTVSAGTYVRAIARDLGARLGTGAHLVSLRREAIGDLGVDDATPPDAVGPGDLLPPIRFVAHLPQRVLDHAEAAAVRHGRAVGADETGYVALVHDGALVAIGMADAGVARPRVVLADA